MSLSISDSPLLRWYSKTPRNHVIRVGVIITIVFFFYFLSRELITNVDMVKTAVQVDFEKYVDEREKHVVLGEPGALALPRISMTILRADMQSSPELILAPAGDASETSKIMRILTLARESGIFGLSHRSTVSGDGVVLRFDDGEKKFETTFSREDIQNNVKAESLLKLLTIHGKPVI